MPVARDRCFGEVDGGGMAPHECDVVGGRVAGAILATLLGSAPLSARKARVNTSEARSSPAAERTRRVTYRRTAMW